MKTVRYLVVKVEIEHPDSCPADDAATLVEHDANYSVQYDVDGVKVVETELLMALTELPFPS